MRIINSVLSVDLNIKLDMDTIKRSFKDAYKPEKFPGTVLKSKKPKVAFLIFPSGKIICSGAKSLDQAEEGFANLLTKFRKKNLYSGKDPKIEIQNLVAMEKLNNNIDIENMGFKTKAIYEPEIFPGAIYKAKDPSASFLLFSNGYIICSGCKSYEDVNISLSKLKEFLKDSELLLPSREIK